MNWKENIKYIIFGVVTLTVLGFLIFSQVKCNKLQKQLNQERIKNLEQVDSLVYVNREHQRKIEEYQKDIISLQSAIDSLKQVKQRIIVKKEEVVISKSTSSAANLLKQNIEKWKR